MINTSQLVPAGASRIPNWVSGGSYVIGDQAISPINFLAYVRKTNGGGVTDPSADSTNWVPFGLAIKQIIRGTIAITAANTTKTATIASVVTSKSVISSLGAVNASATGDSSVILSLTNSTTVSATSSAANGSYTVGYQVVEYY